MCNGSMVGYCSYAPAQVPGSSSQVSSLSVCRAPTESSPRESTALAYFEMEDSRIDNHRKAFMTGSLLCKEVGWAKGVSGRRCVRKDGSFFHN